MTARTRLRQPAISADAGFSLIEMVVSLGLIALLLAALPGALRLGTRALATAQDLDRNAARAAAIDMIERHMAQAMPIYEHFADGRLKIAFRGEPSAVDFLAPAGHGPTGGLYLWELKSTPAADARNDVTLYLSVYRPGLAGQRSIQERQERLLIPDTELALRYFGAPTTTRSDAQWYESWSATDRLPELVEVRFTSRHHDQGRQLIVPLRLRPQP